MDYILSLRVIGKYSDGAKMLQQRFKIQDKKLFALCL